MRIFYLNRLSKIALALFLSGFYYAGFSQNKYLVKNQHDCLIQKNEKVFVQLEKSVYISGEAIDYKAYIIKNNNLKQSSGSKVIYFEIINYNNTPVLSWRANVINGNVSGTIGLPDTISGGIYTLRAFTNWMKNSPPLFYYSTNIIITKINEKNLTNKLIFNPNIPNAEIEFFPEGGNLIENIENKIGYKINSSDSTLKDLVCYVKDIEGSIVTSFQAKKPAIGSFYLTPIAGKNYQVEFTKSNGIQEKINLPAVRKYGYTIHSEIFQNEVKISVHTNMNGFPGGSFVFLTIFSHGNKTMDTTLNLINGSSSFLIAKNRISNGISDVKLLDQEKNKLAERLIFLPPTQLPLVNIHQLKKDYAQGEKIKLEIETSNLSVNDSAEISVSVTTKHPFQQIAANQAITPYLFFNSEIYTTSDISGSQDDSIWTKNANDILLTTNIENYIWSSDFAIAPTHLKEINGFVISGKLAFRSNGSPIKNSLVMISCLDSIAALNYYYTDSLGRFYFYLGPSYDNKELIVQMAGKDTENNDIVLEFDKNQNNDNKTYYNTINLGPESKEYLANCRNIRLINIIYQDTSDNNDLSIQTKHKKAENFYGEPDKQIYPAEYLELVDFKDIVDNLLPGIRFRKKGQTFTIHAIDLTTRDYFSEEALLLLNGVPFNNLQFISTLGSKQVKKVELVQSKIMYGNQTFYGLISVSTFDGKIPNDVNKYIYKNSVASSLDSQNKIKYISQSGDKIPDLKQTLYWNPSLRVTGKNKVSIEFNASDVKTAYSINIQGVTSKGLPLGTTSIFEVK